MEASGGGAKAVDDRGVRGASGPAGVEEAALAYGVVRSEGCGFLVCVRSLLTIYISRPIVHVERQQVGADGRDEAGGFARDTGPDGSEDN